jgi:hypothetical protein
LPVYPSSKLNKTLNFVVGRKFTTLFETSANTGHALLFNFEKTLPFLTSPLCLEQT